MNSLAKFFSAVLHPFLMPLYAFVLLFNFTYLNMTGIELKLSLLSVVATFTLLFPIILLIILRLFRIITSISLRERNERGLPYLLTISCYIALIYTLYRLKVPFWILQLLMGAVIALFVNMLVNSHWKISAHMTGIGGFMAGVMIVSWHTQLAPIYFLMALFVCAGMLGTSRIHLKCHTPAQVYLGFLNGFGCMFFTYFICQTIFKLIR